MTFKAAKCPNCAGDIQVPDDRDSVKCMYCGSDIVVREAIKAAAGGVNIENLLTLAKNAEKAGNREEAYKYYSTVLEHDGQNVQAWVGRGLSTGLADSINCFNKALDISKEDRQEVKQDIIQRIENRSFVKWGRIPNAKNAQNIYECILPGGILANAHSELSIIHQIDPSNDIGLIAVGFQSILHKNGTEALEYFQKALSVTTQKAYVTDIIVARLTEYRYLFEDPSQRRHVIEFVERIKPGSGKPIAAMEQTKKQCFIATAAFGSPMASEVILLRQFRDGYLESRPFGKALTKAYYIISPPLAGIISKSKILRAITRQSLKPIVSIVKVIMGKNL